MVDRLQQLRERLADLLLKQSVEEAEARPCKRYLEDLEISIKSCQDQIQQWTFARGNPLIMVNGVS